MKKVVITGASSGIGEALALEYARQGCDLGLIARRVDRLEALQEKLSKQGVSVSIRALDVSDDRQILPTLEEISQELGGIDLVIANAGITAIHRTGKDDFEINRSVVQLNLIAAMATVDAAVTLFRRENRKGHIVGISSVSAFRGIPGSAAYSGSKAGFSNYLEAVRMELMNKGILVTTVHPGFVKTELSDNMEKYPFVIPVEKAVKDIITGINKRETNIITPKLPWAALSRLITFLPDKLVSKMV